MDCTSKTYGRCSGSHYKSQTNNKIKNMSNISPLSETNNMIKNMSNLSPLAETDRLDNQVDTFKYSVIENSRFSISNKTDKFKEAQEYSTEFIKRFIKSLIPCMFLKS